MMDQLKANVFRTLLLENYREASKLVLSKPEMGMYRVVESNPGLSTACLGDLVNMSERRIKELLLNLTRKGYLKREKVDKMYRYYTTQRG